MTVEPLDTHWLREAVSGANYVSAKRVCMLLASASMSVSLIILAVAAMYGREVALAMGAVAVPLAGMGGYTYVGGIAAGAKNANP